MKLTDLYIALADLAINLLFGFLIWRYYREKTCRADERYSTFGPRFWTGWVDACVLWPVGFLTTVLYSLKISPVVAAGLVIFGNLTWLLYTVVMHARCGQTVGKMVTKVRVVDFKTEQGISWRQAWLREGIPFALSLGLVVYEVFAILTGRVSPADIERYGAQGGEPSWLLSALPFLWFIAEVVTMLMNDKNRALHDLLAGTVVIRTNIPEQSNAVSAAPNPGPPDAAFSPAN